MRPWWFFCVGFLLFLGCEGKEGPTGSQGPEGPQGPPGEKGDPGSSATIYPEHVKKAFSHRVYLNNFVPGIPVKEWPLEEYVMADTIGIEFDSQFTTRWTTGGRWRDAFPDLLIIARLDTAEVTRRQLELPSKGSLGNLYVQPYSFQDTDIYYTNKPLRLIGRIPEPDQLIQKPIILEQSDSFVIRTRANRWAKMTFPQIRVEEKSYTFMDKHGEAISATYHYDVKSVIEWYYYKTSKPDFSIH